MSRMLITGTVAVGLCLATALARADDRATGLEEFTWANDDKALQLLLPYAKEGDREAQLCVALIYRGGHGKAATDLPTAASWFSRAADQGDPRAMAYLAFMYEHGSGVALDLVLAYDYYTNAAGRYLLVADQDEALDQAHRIHAEIEAEIANGDPADPAIMRLTQSWKEHKEINDAVDWLTNEVDKENTK